MDIDLTEHTFIKEFTVKARVGDIDLEYGVIIDRRLQQGRPGVAGEYRPQLREGAGDHATIYVRRKEKIYESNGISIGDKIETVSGDCNESESWLVRAIKGPVAGAMEYLVAIDGSRLIDTSRNRNNVTGVRQ